MLCVTATESELNTRHFTQSQRRTKTRITYFQTLNIYFLMCTSQTVEIRQADSCLFCHLHDFVLTFQLASRYHFTWSRLFGMMNTSDTASDGAPSTRPHNTRFTHCLMSLVTPSDRTAYPSPVTSEYLVLLYLHWFRNNIETMNITDIWKHASSNNVTRNNADGSRTTEPSFRAT
jgi:hypothetical protein